MVVELKNELKGHAELIRFQTSENNLCRQEEEERLSGVC